MYNKKRPTPRTAAATESRLIAEGEVSIGGTQRMSIAAAESFRSMSTIDRGKIWEMGYEVYLKQKSGEK